jgi:hypothetical protein
LESSEKVQYPISQIGVDTRKVLSGKLPSDFGTFYESEVYIQVKRGVGEWSFPIKMVVDTGAHISLISSEFLPFCVGTPFQYRFYDANSNPIDTIIGQLELRFIDEQNQVSKTFKPWIAFNTVNLNLLGMKALVDNIDQMILGKTSLEIVTER